MPKVKKTAKIYTIQVIATVEVVASFEIEAETEGKAKSEAESLFEDEVDGAISNISGYDTYTTESIESEVIDEE